MLNIVHIFFKKKAYNFFKKSTPKDIYKAIEDSRLFDGQFYLRTNSDVAQAGFDPLGHFIHSGAIEGRSPSIKFDLPAYLEANPRARTSGLNPIIDWLEFGPKGERVAPTPLLSKDAPAYYETFGWLSDHSNSLNSKSYTQFFVSSTEPSLPFPSSENYIHESYILTAPVTEPQRDALFKAIKSLSCPNPIHFFVDASCNFGDPPTIGLVFIGAHVQNCDSAVFINAPEVRLYFIDPHKLYFIHTFGPIFFSGFKSQLAASEWHRQLLLLLKT